MDQWGYCLPLKNSSVCTPIVMVLNQSINNAVAPYFCFSDEKNTVKLFVDALTGSHLDDAKAYISKNYVRDFDLNELSDFFNKTCNYKSLIKVEFTSRPKNCKTDSILVLGSEGARCSIVHLHMVKEPDRFSKWKIYGIEKE